MDLKESIVAVDDSRIVLTTLESMLGEQYGFRGFAKAERGLNYIKQFPPSLIILDIDMPEMDGYTMLDKIRENTALKNIPVIFLTSNNEKDYVIKAMKYGVGGYVVKPIDKEILISKIEALLSGQA